MKSKPSRILPNINDLMVLVLSTFGGEIHVGQNWVEETSLDQPVIVEFPAEGGVTIRLPYASI